MSEWRECKLGEIVDIRSGKRLPKGSLLVNHDTGHPYIRVTDLGRKWIKKNGLHFVNPEEQKKISKYIVLGGDVVISIVGTTGLVGRVSDELDNANLTENCVRLIPHSNFLDNDYLYYFLISKTGQEEIKNGIVGSTQPKLPLYNIKIIDIKIPPLPEQKAIASVLSSLDDKIDLLHRQNKTLEAMAETLFRQWFVEEADDGWEEVNLLEIVQLVGGGTPKTSIKEYWDGNIYWLSGGDIACNHKTFISTSEKLITGLGLENSSAKLLPKYSTVISARGTVGKYCILAEPMAFSQSNYGIVPKKGDCYFFTYLLINHVVSELILSAYGSVFDTITTATFKNITLSMPSDTEVEKFEKNIKEYFYKMLNNKTQIQTIEKIRDTLLPNLMNGKVRVKM